MSVQRCRSRNQPVADNRLTNRQAAFEKSTKDRSCAAEAPPGIQVWEIIPDYMVNFTTIFHIQEGMEMEKCEKSLICGEFYADSGTDILPGIWDDQPGIRLRPDGFRDG